MMLAWLKSIFLRNPAPLEQSVGSAALVRMTALALALMAFAVALVQLRDGSTPTAVEPRPAIVDPLASELARCRTVTPEQLSADETCRRVWAENRRRFFEPSASRHRPASTDPAATGSAMPPKIQDRIPSEAVPGESIEAR